MGEATALPSNPKRGASQRSVAAGGVTMMLCDDAIPRVELVNAAVEEVFASTSLVHALVVIRGGLVVMGVVIV